MGMSVKNHGECPTEFNGEIAPVEVPFIDCYKMVQWSTDKDGKIIILLQNSNMVLSNAESIRLRDELNSLALDFNG